MSSFLNFKDERAADTVGVVCISNSNVTAHGGDSEGRQFDKDFVYGVLDGPTAMLTIVPRDIADSWTKHKGALLRKVSSNMARELHARAKKHEGKYGKAALKSIWQDVMKEPWPGDAEARNDSEERLRLTRQLTSQFYPVSQEWTIEQLRRYAAAPELIAEDRLVAMGAKPTATYDPPKTEIPDDVVDEFLKGSDD